MSKKVRPLEAMPASKQAYKKRAERLSFCMANRKRYEVTCDRDNLMRVIEGQVKFQYRKRYEVTCDRGVEGANRGSLSFQYRKRYEVTCDHQGGYCQGGLDDVSIPQAV